MKAGTKANESFECIEGSEFIGGMKVLKALKILSFEHSFTKHFKKLVNTKMYSMHG